MRAIIDIGSNSVLMIVGEIDGHGHPRLVAECSEVVRLSEGVAASGRLGADAIARTLTLLERYASLARRHGAGIRAVATAGVRMAANAHEFLRPASDILGAEVQVISGHIEARLSYLSVARECPPDAQLRVVDIGGGSTELVDGRGRDITDAISHPVGTVRLLESHELVTDEPPSQTTLDRVRQTIADVLARQPLSPLDVLHGVAGTVTSCAGVIASVDVADPARAMAEVDGMEIPRERLDALAIQITTLGTEQRRQLPGLRREHVEVIVSGVLLLQGLMAHCGARILRVRNRGLRYALLAGEELGEGSSIDPTPANR